MSDKSTKFWLIIKVSIWVIVFLILAFTGAQVYLAEKYEAHVRVISDKDKIGVNPTSTSIDFGDLAGDTAAIRYVTLKSEGMKTFIYVMKFGAIAELIDISENKFTLKKGEEKKIEFQLYLPPSASQGTEYLGRVWIFKIPKIW